MSEEKSIELYKVSMSNLKKFTKHHDNFLFELNAHLAMGHPEITWPDTFLVRISDGEENNLQYFKEDETKPFLAMDWSENAYEVICALLRSVGKKISETS